MLKEKFYHGTVRKAITAFGSLFTDIYIDRINEKTGKADQTIKIPLLYSPRQQSIATIEATPESYEQEFQSILPRMGFEIVGLQYDPSRQISQTQYTMAQRDSKTQSSLYAPAPYIISITLSIYTRNQDDGWQIVEQIIPLFNPDYNVNKNSMPDLGLEEDIPIILNSVNFNDMYDGTYAERRMIIWDLSFSLKLNFFGPVRKTSVIKRTKIDVVDQDSRADIAHYKAEIVPFSAEKDDFYVIDDSWWYSDKG